MATFFGTPSDDDLLGTPADDTFRTSPGRDTLDGGDGIDSLAISPPPPLPGSVVAINFGSTSVKAPALNIDTTFSNFERVEMVYFNSPVTFSIDASQLVLPSGPFSFDRRYGVDITTGTGNDTILGSAGVDRIDAGSGVNAISSGAGDDEIRVTGSGSTIDGGDGFDRVTISGLTGNITVSGSVSSINVVSDTVSNSEFLLLEASGGAFIDATNAPIGIQMRESRGSFDDTLVGSQFNDSFYLAAGLGNDIVSGGAGIDTFFFNFDFGVPVKGIDGTTITDFELGETLNLSQGNDPEINSFLGRGAFTGVAGEVRYEFSNGQTVIQFDYDGDRISDASLTLGNGMFALRQKAVPQFVLEIDPTGTVSDGLLSGATVFADANGNGTLDPGEQSVTTDGQGQYSWSTAPSGPIIAQGGTNIDTGLPNLITLQAPAGSGVVNPLTLLIKSYMDNQATDAATAEAAVKAAFGIAPSLDLLSVDLVAASASSAPALEAQKIAAMVANIVTAGAEISGMANAEATVLGSLVKQIAASPAGALNLADAPTLQTVLGTVLSGSTLDAYVSTLAAANAAIDNSSSLAGVAAGQLAALAPLVSTSYSASDVSLMEGDNGTNVAFVQISRPASQPLIAQTLYAKIVGGSAAQGQDYTVATGVTFGAGQTTASAVLFIQGDTEFEPDETVTIEFYTDASFTNLATSATVTITNDDTQPAGLQLGTNGNDLIFATGAANVIMSGGAGDDTYVIGNLNDQIIEAPGDGNDTVLSSISYALNGGAFVDNVSTQTHADSSPINLIGNFHSQQMIGNFGSNVLNGNGGIDTLIGLKGDDIYVVGDPEVVVREVAGEGFDAVYTRTSYKLGAGVSVEVLSTDTHSGTNPINLTGNEFDQQIIGNMAANIIDGGGGKDVLIGLGGADTFAFTTALGSGNIDTIQDFSASEGDRISLASSIFDKLTTGVLSASALTTGPQATSADHRIIYNKDTGQLFYDPDGNGSSEAILFATVNPGTLIEATNITVT